MMTTSRRSSVGARHCSTYARKIVPFIGPSITKALLANPAPPRPRHVRPFLLRRAQAFFDGDIMSLEKSPDRGATAWNSLLAHRRNDLVQGQIRLFGYQSQQPFHVLLQRRRAPAAQLCSGASSVTPALQPPHRGTGAQAEAFGRFPPRCPGHDGFDHAFPQEILPWTNAPNWSSNTSLNASKM